MVASSWHRRWGLALDHSFLDGVDAQKGRWRDAAAEAKGVSTRYYWIGKGRDALEVAYGTAESKPNAATVREVWKRRHGRAAAVIALVDDLGLEPPPPVEPLPEIDERDVNLVTWMALVPGDHLARP